MKDKLGICQWFHYQAYLDVERAVTAMRQLGIKRLRTGISWADFHRPRGPDWYDWLMGALAEFEVLLSVWHTPPSISEGGTCSSPPRRLEDYADFIGQVIDLYGSRFDELELWNEPNNLYKWDFKRFDPSWSKFAQMIRLAGAKAHDMDKTTVLGGMIPVDHEWLRKMRSYGALDDIDIIAIHGFPGMWWEDEPSWDKRSHWHGWEEKVDRISEHCEGRPVWVTETGLATCDIRTGEVCKHEEQAGRLEAAARAPAERVYWYSLVDLDPRRSAIEGFHIDENEYHLGLLTHDGHQKQAWWAMKRLLGVRVREAGLPSTG